MVHIRLHGIWKWYSIISLFKEYLEYVSKSKVETCWKRIHFLKTNFQIYHIRWKEESRYTRRSKVFHYFKLNRRIFKSTSLFLFQYSLLILHCKGIEERSTQSFLSFNFKQNITTAIYKLIQFCTPGHQNRLYGICRR